MTEIKRVRVRFAPSPTGHLHVGGARTAIFNWLFARHNQGDFLIRIEDTDQARSTSESETMVLDDLRWLGLHWDEGPDNGGPHAPYRQSERTDLYRSIGQHLLSTAHVYRCFCSEEELKIKRKMAEAAGQPPHYDLTCFRLNKDAIEQKIQDGASFVTRFHVPRHHQAQTFDGDVTIHDLIRGEVTWKAESLGDFIVLRSDGMPTYNFSVVVDDHDMDITHVIRAEEHLTNTHRQVLIYRALGWDVPQFAHVSLILGADRSKLSKRHGATSVSAFADEGYLPEAMFNFLALLGWSPPSGQEIFHRDYVVESFSLDRVNPAPAVFDPHKFQWVNSQYIHSMEAPRLRGLLTERFRSEEWIRGDAGDVERWFDDAIDLVKKGLHSLNEFVPAMRFLFEFDLDRLLNDKDNRAALEEEGARDVILLLADELRANGTPGNSEAYHALAERLKLRSGQKGKKLFMPIRIAVTGSTHGPELHRVVPLLEQGTGIAGLAPIDSPLVRVEKLSAHWK